MHFFNAENSPEKNHLSIELRRKNPDVFHDFLLITAPERFEILPNPSNVGELIEMANLFGVDFYMKDCVRHLKLARNILAADRIALLRKHSKYNIDTFVLRAFAEML